MEQNTNEPERPAGPQGRGLKQPSGGSPTEAPARSGVSREDIASAGSEAEPLQADHPLAEHNNPLLPAFTPVPRLKDRSNGWKPHIQQRFIEALAETGSVVAACRRVGRSDMGAYQLRRHPAAGEFRAAWDAALDLGVRRIEDGAMDRALYGTEEVVVQNGDTIVKRRRYNERLVMFILRNRAPERFSEGGARGLSAVDTMRLKRLKEAWRDEWEHERRRKEPDIEEVRAEIMRKVAAIKAADRTRWSKHEAQLHTAWQAVRDERRAREQEEARRDYIARQNPHMRARMEAEDRAARERGDVVEALPSLPDLLGDDELD